MEQPLILFVARRGNPEFPRFVVQETNGSHWDGHHWVTSPNPPLVFHSILEAAFTYDALQREAAEIWPHRAIATVPVIFECYSRHPVDLRKLVEWLQLAVDLTINMNHGHGPAEDSVVLANVHWTKGSFQNGETI